MIKCPNCGSISKASFLWVDHFTTSHSTEVWECKCGCRIERVLKEQNRIVTYPNGEVKYEETYKGAKI